MKKAFYPGMVDLGRMRPATGARTVSSRAVDQDTWQGLVSFRDTGSGTDTIFATQDLPQREEDKQTQEPVASEGPSTNANYFGLGQGGSGKDS